MRALGRENGGDGVTPLDGKPHCHRVAAHRLGNSESWVPRPVFRKALFGALANLAMTVFVALTAGDHTRRARGIDTRGGRLCNGLVAGTVRC